MADFFTRVPGPLEVMRRLGLNVPSSKQLGKFSTAVPEFVGPQADVAGMVRDAGQVMPNIRSGDYGQALANLGMAAAAIPFMAIPGTVSQIKGVTKKVTDELPMDTASRMARAKEMGFDTEKLLYRGTTEKGAKAAKPSFEAGEGVFLTDNPDVAEIFRYPREWGESITGKFDEVSGEYIDIEPGDLQELFARIKKPLRLNAKDAEKFTYDTAFQSKTIRNAKNSDYDSIVVPSVKEGVGDWVEEGTTYVVLDPKNIRARSAKFDPSKKTSANLLAGAAGGMLFAPAFMDNE